MRTTTTSHRLLRTAAVRDGADPLGRVSLDGRRLPGAPPQSAAGRPASLEHAASGTERSASAPATRTPTGTAGRPGTTGAQSVSALVQQLDTCIHQHGAPNFPDPYVDAAGKVAFPDSAPDLPASAQSACQHIIDQLPNPGNAGPTAISAADFQRWLTFAVCMRTHGLPAWPDPKSDGSFPAAIKPSRV